MNYSASLDATFATLVSAHLCAVLLLGLDLRREVGAGRPASVYRVPVVCFGSAGLVCVLAGLHVVPVLLAATAGCALGIILTHRLTDYRESGVIILLTLALSYPAMVLAISDYLAGLALDAWTLLFLWAGWLATAALVPSILIQTFENWEVALRLRWHRPNGPKTDWVPTSTAPMVSIHVPAHAEPPDLVIATLDALARLDYPDYEVLLIDNNTTDEKLWRPVKEHCARLGPRFRFLHVEGITGAKAGALNWARPHTNPRAELVALIDADYQVDPHWLVHTVGYFDDPEIGFVQCPHAYRGYADSTFGRMANASYAMFMATEMVSLNEHGAGITVGTVSVIRLAALDEAGGWANWCMTEDSELAIRLHVLGYSSVYVNHQYGWGIIPETFAGYKKQRFRWTFGPGQELRFHYRSFLSAGPANKLTLRQRVHHFNHGFTVLLLGIKILTLPLHLVTLTSMMLHREVLPLHYSLIVPCLGIAVGRHLMRWLLYRKIIGATAAEYAGAIVVFMAQSYVQCVSGLGILLGRSALWERTDKFRTKFIRSRVIKSTWIEMFFAVVIFAFAVLLPLRLPLAGTTLLLVLGLYWQGITFLMAPAVAFISERDVARRPDSDSTGQNGKAALSAAAALPARNL